MSNSSLKTHHLIDDGSGSLQWGWGTVAAAGAWTPGGVEQGLAGQDWIQAQS